MNYLHVGGEPQVGEVTTSGRVKNETRVYMISYNPVAYVAT